MNSLSEKKLAVFFTRGVSLSDWAKIGNLSRELKIYLELKKSFKQINFFTYGKSNDVEYLGEFKNLFGVFPKKNNLPNWLYSLLLPLYYRKELRGVDVYKTNQMDGAWTAVLAKIIFGKKLLVRCGYEWYRFACNQHKRRWYRWLVFLIEYVSYKSADQISLTSDSDKDFVVKTFRLKESNVNLIPNYIDIDIFSPMNLGKDYNKLIFVGRLNRQKNLINLVKAVNGLGLELIMYGEGEERSLLEKLIADDNSKVHLRGNIKNEELPREINKAGIFVLPSLYEGNPKTLLEAMSCGATVIGTKVEGIESVIRHNKNGILCGTDSDSIRQAIVSTLQDKELMVRLGQQARRDLVAGHSLGSAVEKELKIYNQLLV